ncbi:hypothetical protein [Phenylobacterium aquaticum]|uniref:hypothetical protein n=1 Tax=Phenylobacterium aquaticum TaxID=1763816 RepID=UPI0026ECD3F9|nr:hypothetical protein [Phenylobacterium aquaticum]
MSPSLPRNPLFFCARLQYRGYNQKVIEYCVVDVFAERVLEFTASWRRGAGGGDWLPSNRALAGLALLHETVRGRAVIVDSDTDEEAPPRRVIQACAQVMELTALYGHGAVRTLRPQIEDEVASIRLAAFDGETTAYHIAARLREVWVLLDAELRGPKPGHVPEDPPASPRPVSLPTSAASPVAAPVPPPPPQRDGGPLIELLVCIAAGVLVALAAVTAFAGVIFAHRDIILMELRDRVRI